MPDYDYDVVIVGAGISGISAAWHLQKHCPDKSYRILDKRSALGGTWDLFNYPGIRSDSDMYTFGFGFNHWADQSSIASKAKILDYLADTADKFGITQHFQFQTEVTHADWDSAQVTWTLAANENGVDKSLRCQYLFMCSGYYNYEQACNPQFPGQSDFKGQIIHPQFWPDDLDYQDKNVVVVGSGATAITLVPAMAETVKHITMLQRSPTYIAARPAIDPIANKLASWAGRWAARWWYILNSLFLYNYCRWFPERARRVIMDEVKAELGEHFDSCHFTPKYKPWDQRLCLCPDGDLFAAIKMGKASIVTDKIMHFTDTGIRLLSGDLLEADIIVTATGLQMLCVGGLQFSVDGEPVEFGKKHVYKGFMCDAIPNMFLATGYTNASWTLKVDLTNRYACRLINYIDNKGLRFCSPDFPQGLESVPLLDLTSGYIQRSIDEFPKQASRAPWRLYQNYLYDKFTLAFRPLKDAAMKFN